MASTAFLANSVTNSVSAEGVLKWLNEIAASKPFVKKPEFTVAQIAKILQNKKARDIIYHLVANTRSRNHQIEVIGNLFLQKKLSHEEIAFWRDRLPELQLPDVASNEDGAASIEPQAARHLIKKQNALREVEQLTEQVLKSKAELMTLTKTAADVNEKLRSASAGNLLRQAYLDQLSQKCDEWRKTTSELRRRLVSAGARSAKFGSINANQPGKERVNQASGDLAKICQKLVDSMLDDVAMVRGGTMAMGDTTEVVPMVQKLVGEFTVGEIGAALLSNLNKSVADLEAEIDRVDISAEIKELMFDFEPSTGELRDTSPLVVQPASQVMAALTLERQSALLKVSGEAAEARMDLRVLEGRFHDLMSEVNQELKKWLRKEPAVLSKIERYVQVSCSVAGFEQAEKALHVCSQAVDAEIRLLEARNRDASFARSRLAGFQQELENQLVQIRRLLESTASMRKEHEAILSKVSTTVATLPQQSQSFGMSLVSVREAKLEELNDFSTKNLSALTWSFSASALKRFLSTCNELFANLPASAAKHEIATSLLCLGPSSLLQSVRDNMVLYRCRLALLERLNAVLSQAKASKYDEKRVRSVIDQHNTIATQNWEKWSEELTQACRDCQNAIEEGLPNYRGLISDWRSQPGQFAADWVQLDGLTYREYFRNVTFLTDSIRQREEMKNDNNNNNQLQN